MANKKRLIELLMDFHSETNFHICDGCGSKSAEDVCGDIADYLIANDVTIQVRCKDCKHRGDDVNCPMCFEEEIEWDDDGYTEVDWITHNHTHDDGFCDRGERKDNEEQT